MKILTEPDVRQALEHMQFRPYSVGQQDDAALVKGDIRFWKYRIDRLGISNA